MSTQTPDPQYAPQHTPEPPTVYMPGPPAPVGSQTKPRRSVPLLIAVLVGSGLTLVSCIGGVAVGAAGQPAAKPAPAASTVTKTVQLPAPAASTVTITKPAEAAPPPPAPKATIGEGTWSVGDDFPAGTYKATGAGATCYWAISKGGSNGSDIIENHMGGGNLRVTLKAGQEFTSNRCGTWDKVG